MSETTTGSTASGTARPTSRIETDTFCERCGYNLHSLAVTRDERLGILVVRCPECGAFQPAGRTTGVGRVWLNRLGTTLLVLWIGFLLAAIVGLGILMAVWEGVILDEFLHYGFLVPPPYLTAISSSPAHVQWWQLQAVIVAGLMVISALFLGGFVAVFLWHLRRGLQYVWLIVPLLVAMLMWFAFILPPYTAQEGATVRILAVFAMLFVQWMAMIVGLHVGRPVARVALRLLLPVRLMQHLSFLWTVDGRVAPSVSKARQ